MAKRRMITQDINIDETLNNISVESQLLFIKILSVSDDCGVVPANDFTLKSLTNPPEKLRENFTDYISEIIKAGLMFRFEYNSKPYLCFKRESFERQQAYIIKNRTKSEYLKVTVEAFISIYEQILGLIEIPVNSCKFPQVSLLTHSKLKAKSIELQAKSKKQKGDFISELIVVFQEQYLTTRQTEYLIVNEGKERKAMGALLSAYKKKNPEAKSEQTINDFRNLFNAICSAPYKSEFLNGITIPMVSSNLMKYIAEIKKLSKKGNDWEYIFS